MKKRVIGFVVLLGIALIIAVLGMKKIDNLNTQIGGLQEENTQLKTDVSNQSKVIADQSLSFHRANQISSAAYRNGIIQRASAEERKIEYKTILKKEPSCDLPVPRFISDRLLSNAYRLRAIAMHTNTENANAASTAITTGRILTYCDLALWVDPLLTDLEQANTQLMAIEKFDEEREHEKVN
ncbi:MAG: DUF2570 domain-containing protein [Providencia rustigianii]|uniref:DUF2570 domain-containing protein n=1 Tax=Providencia TaxID=586 RepID=UPI0022446668|nr:DUF2570 domain-containing protein [Providencia rustigianii]